MLSIECHCEVEFLCDGYGLVDVELVDAESILWGLRCCEVVPEHVCGALESFVWSGCVRFRLQLFLELGLSWGNSRVNSSDAAFAVAVEFAFAAATGEDLGFYH